MKKLFRLHYHYLFNRTNLLILFAVFFLSFLGFLESALSFKDDISGFADVYYFESSFFFLKLIVIFIAVFTFAYSLLPKADQYVELILVGKASRAFYFGSKVFVIFLYLTYFLILEFSLYMLCGACFFNKFSSSNFSAFLNLLMLGLYYGLLSLAFMQILRNLYVIVIPFLLFITGSIVNEKSGAFSDYFNLLIPNFIAERPELYHGSIHVLMMIIILFLLNLLFYLSRDL